jgi:NodT family efflux transporter outer membrane factor (OMF) lipoprotein
MDRSLILVILILLGSSCNMDQDYTRPKVELGNNFKEAKGFVPAPKKEVTFGNGKWWEIYHDANLNKFEDTLMSANQTIANAKYNYELSKNLIAEAQAAFFPTIDGDFGVDREQIASTTSNFKRLTNTFYSDLNASFTPDITGTIMLNVKSYEFYSESQRALLKLTQLNSQGSLAVDYFQLRALLGVQKYLDLSVKANKAILAINENKYKSGIVDNNTITTSYNQLKTAEAASINNQVLIRQYEHAIAVLLGKTPERCNFNFAPLAFDLPNIPTKVPSTVLQNRPDISQALYLVYQDAAEIGLEENAYYPSFTLTGTGSLTAVSLSNFFASPLSAWTLGSKILETIFDGGLRDANILAARNTYKAQVASYKQTVLAAMQNVDDNLSALRIYKSELAADNNVLKATQTSLDYAKNQYTSGIVDDISVLNAKLAVYAAWQNYYNVLGQEFVASANLLVAMGG